MSVPDLQTVVSRRTEKLGDHAVVLATFTATLFFSALLLFSVQPIFAKMVLPTLGGSPSVWAVSMCFFQAALLAGYSYAHILNKVVTLRVATMVHVVLLAIAVLALPFGLPEGTEPPAGDAYLWLVGTLIVGVGLPFFAISANAPLLQAWFARTGHPHSNDPYFLYGASNLGSLLALLSYPVVIEPLIGLNAQAWTWTAGFVFLGILVVGCSVLLRITGALDATPNNESSAHVHDHPITLMQRLTWVALAFVPSGLLVAYTTYVATDVASAPFVWVIPLATFLGTFVLVFRTTPVVPTKLLLAAQPALVALALLDVTTIGLLGSLPAILIGFAAFFVTTMVAHTTLYDVRPQSSRLTEFYMWMSLGGVLGGVFAALIAPQVFNTIYEFPLLLVVGMFCRPGLFSAARKLPSFKKFDTVFILFGVVAVLAVAFALGWLTIAYSKISFLVLTVLAIGLAFMARERPTVQCLYIAALGLAVFVLPSRINVGHSERSFYGVHKVRTTEDGQVRMLSHGTTIHGAQRLFDINGEKIDPPRPATYYHRDGLMARGLFAGRLQAETHGRTFSAGIVGVGTGSLACFARQQETWKFYEIDPLVVKLATDPKLFNFFSSCRPNADFVIGDARLTLAREHEGKFDYLVIDAFSSDAVPVHLITREALEMYLLKTTQTGVVALHISNRHMDLPTSAIATALSIPGVHVALGLDETESSTAYDKESSHVLFLSRSEDALAGLAAQKDITIETEAKTVPWTDDYANVIASIWRKKK